MLRVVVAPLLCIGVATTAVAQSSASASASDGELMTIRSRYLPPSDLLELLGAEQLGGLAVVAVRDAPVRYVEVRHNDAANLLILSGAPSDVERIEGVIREVDAPPRQIQIVVTIVEINQSKARDLGIDWEGLLDSARPSMAWRYAESDAEADAAFNRGKWVSDTADNRGELRIAGATCRGSQCRPRWQDQGAR